MYLVTKEGEVVEGGTTKVEKPIVLCAGGVVWIGKGMIVLVRPLDSSDQWLLPKGHIEKGESEAQAAVREVMEESGAVCSLEDSQPICVTTHETEKEIKSITWFNLRAAALKTERAEVVVERAILHREIGIFPALVALARLTHQEHREVLCTALGGALVE